MIKTENDFEQYIKDIFSSQKWSNILLQMNLTYNKMNEKYSEENWNKEWKKLCDGKCVFNQLVAKMAAMAGISTDNLKNKIIKTAIEKKESELSILLNEIRQKYC